MNTKFAITFLLGLILIPIPSAYIVFTLFQYLSRKDQQKEIREDLICLLNFGYTLSIFFFIPLLNILVWGIAIIVLVISVLTKKNNIIDKLSLKFIKSSSNSKNYQINICKHYFIYSIIGIVAFFPFLSFFYCPCIN